LIWRISPEVQQFKEVEAIGKNDSGFKVGETTTTTQALFNGQLFGEKNRRRMKAIWKAKFLAESNKDVLI